MKIEKIPPLKCKKCGSHCVTLLESGISCDDCEEVTAKTSDEMSSKKRQLEEYLTSN